MARLTFQLPTVPPNQRVRLDLVPGAVSPADVETIGGTPIAGAVVTADGTGALGSVLGPDGAAILHGKALDAQGAESGRQFRVHAASAANYPQTGVGVDSTGLFVDL